MSVIREFGEKKLTVSAGTIIGARVRGMTVPFCV